MTTYETNHPLRFPIPEVGLAFALSPDNRFLAYNYDFFLIIENMETGKVVYQVSQSAKTTCVRFAPWVGDDGTQVLAFGAKDEFWGTITFDRNGNGVIKQREFPEKLPCKYIDWHPSGDYLLVDMAIVDLQSLKVVVNVAAYDRDGACFPRNGLFSTCGRYVFLVCEQHILGFELVRRGSHFTGVRLIHTHRFTHCLAVSDVCLSQDCCHYVRRGSPVLFTMCTADLLQEDGLRTSYGIKTYPCAEAVDTLELSNDRRLCAAISTRTGYVAVISTETNELVQSVTGFSGNKPRVAFASDQSFLLLTQADGRNKVEKIPLRRDLSAEKIEELFGDIKNASKTS